jgi:RNA polymerase sigma-70 factor, ECF subfamily
MSRWAREVSAALLADAEIVAAVLDGDRDCYGVLVGRYQESMFRMAISMVMDSDAAADLVQDVFVRAYTSLDTCREPQRFRFWLLRMLRNRCLDHLKEKRRLDVSLDNTLSAMLPAEPGHDALDRLAERTELGRALAVLSPALREAFVLRHVEELSYDEIAELLDVSVSALKMRVMRARETLRAELRAGEEIADQGGV